LRSLHLRVPAWLPVALLLGVAANHFALARRCGLHPWLGGGFGMFSTVDTREVHAWRISAGGEERLALPRDLEEAARRAEALPSERRVADLARDLARSGPADAGVRVEVWETRFGSSMRPEPRRLRSVTLGVRGTPP
jgi:hypothetical protein